MIRQSTIRFACLVNLFVSIVIFDLPFARAQGVSKMYWSDRGANTIRRANFDGSNVEILADGMQEVRGVAVDWVSHRLYWADNGANKIQRSLLHGSQVEDLVTQGLDFPAGIALDTAANKMYWADANTGKIQRANLDGSSVEDLVTGLGRPYYVSLDLQNAHIYWTDHGSDKIQRSDLNGMNVVDLVTTGLSLPRGIDLDLPNNKMYWADRATDVIQRSNMDGSAIETLHSATPSSAAPHGVAVDGLAGHVYWVDNGLVTLKRANLDGSDTVTILDRDSGELERPWQIVLDTRMPGTAADAATIDALSQAIRDDMFDDSFDLTRNGVVDLADRQFLIHYVQNTGLGDSNLDGHFDSRDLVTVFTAGQYQDAVVANSTWATGDWNGDSEFDSADFVDALQQNQYSSDSANAIPVPEPTSLVALNVTLLWLGTRCQKLRSIQRR